MLPLAQAGRCVHDCPRPLTRQTNNASANGSYTGPGFDGTQHVAAQAGASLNFSFTGSNVALYGATGPSFGAYTVQIDGGAPTRGVAYQQNGTTYRQLYAQQSLAQGPHSVVVTSLGADTSGYGSQLLFDYAAVTVQVGGAGATLTNTTYDDGDSRLVYTGNWTCV